MMTLVVFLWIHAGKKASFTQYERHAIEIVRGHGGTLVKAFKPTLMVGKMPAPDEVHILTFPTEEVFAQFRADSRLVALQALREEAIRDTMIVGGIGVVQY